MSIEVSEVSSSTPSVNSRQISAAIVSSVLGWSLDLFDLFVLLYVAPVIGKLFFPSANATLSLASVYASFAVTLLMRPVGSGVFGSYADKHGRKKAMMIAIVGVGIFTALLGALPTVHQVGVLAPILFLVLRLVQGVFVGGVVASTHTIGTETVPPKWRGLMSGLIGGGGAGIGSLIASVIYWILVSIFPGSAFNVWGWRFMFFSALLSAVLGLFIFNSLEESPFWLSATSDSAKAVKAPVRMVFSKRYLPTLIINLMVVIGGGSGYYLTSGYLPTFLKVINKSISESERSEILIFASIIIVFAAVLVGQLSEYIGRKKTFMVFGLIGLVGLPLLYHGLAGAHTFVAVTLYALVLSFIGNAAYAPVLIFLNERFPTEIRSTGTGLSWNMGFAIGGMMPTFVTLSSGTVSNIPTSLGWFIGVIFLVYVIGSFIIPETKGRFA